MQVVATAAPQVPGLPIHVELALRAEHFMRAHLDEPQTVTLICDGVRCKPRTLNKACHLVFGMSPMAYFRFLRLAKVRHLLVSEAARRVTELATDCGFSHLGHFAAAYKSRYGETPSETRRRAARVTTGAQ
jgi:AraC family ethanolamine operon transcriptional activator